MVGMSEERVESEAVIVDKRVAERARKLLLRHGLLAKSFKAARVGDQRVAFPVVDSGLASKILEEEGIPFEAGKYWFTPVKKPGRLQGRVKSFKIIGDIVVFSRSGDVPLEEYVDSAVKLLGENPRLRAAWLKVETGGEERLPKLIHLAGERKTRAVVKEYGVRLVVDISRAYYNPRLAGEHWRVADLTRDGELVLDMFTGVGAFALHIAKRRKTIVVASDINYDALRLAGESLALNRRLSGAVILFNADARALPLNARFDRIIMNLPKDSLRFIPEACRLISTGGFIHIYTLQPGSREAVEAVESALYSCGCTPIVELSRKVLDYSPTKSIYVVDVMVKERREHRECG